MFISFLVFVSAAVLAVLAMAVLVSAVRIVVFLVCMTRPSRSPIVMTFPGAGRPDCGCVEVHRTPLTSVSGRMTARRIDEDSDGEGVAEPEADGAAD